MNTSADLWVTCGGGQLGIGQIIGQLLENGIADSAQLSIVVDSKGIFFVEPGARRTYTHATSSFSWKRGMPACPILNGDYPLHWCNKTMPDKM